jgi:hypothetical protein
MKSVFIAAEGPIRVTNAHTGALTDMTAEPAGRGAAIVAAHALAFLLIGLPGDAAAAWQAQSWCLSFCR